MAQVTSDRFCPASLFPPSTPLAAQVEHSGMTFTIGESGRSTKRFEPTCPAAVWGAADRGAMIAMDPSVVCSPVPNRTMAAHHPATRASVLQ